MSKYSIVNVICETWAVNDDFWLRIMLFAISRRASKHNRFGKGFKMPSQSRNSHFCYCHSTEYTNPYIIVSKIYELAWRILRRGKRTVYGHAGDKMDGGQISPKSSYTQPVF